MGRRWDIDATIMAKMSRPCNPHQRNLLWLGGVGSKPASRPSARGAACSKATFSSTRAASVHGVVQRLQAPDAELLYVGACVAFPWYRTRHIRNPHRWGPMGSSRRCTDHLTHAFACQQAGSDLDADRSHVPCRGGLGCRPTLRSKEQCWFVSCVSVPMLALPAPKGLRTPVPCMAGRR